MGARSDASSHLDKAREFLDAATLELDVSLSTDATKAVEWATRMVDTARDVAGA